MIPVVILNFIDLFVFIFNILIVARVVASYIANQNGAFYQGLVSLTEPILAPIRRLLPQTAGFDLAPLVAFLLLQGLQYVARAVLAHSL